MAVGWESIWEKNYTYLPMFVASCRYALLPQWRQDTELEQSSSSAQFWLLLQSFCFLSLVFK